MISSWECYGNYMEGTDTKVHLYHTEGIEVLAVPRVLRKPATLCNADLYCM